MTRLARGMTSVTILGILAAVLIAMLVIVVWLKPHPQPIPERERFSRDSLTATQPRYDTVRIATVKLETLFVAKSTESARQATNATRVADSLRRVADALTQAAASSGEASERWYEVATVRKQENDSLRSANVSLVTALSEQTTARHAADVRADAAEQRLAATSDLSARLANDLKHGDCRVMVFLSCPSRRASLVIGLAAGAISYAVGEKVVRK